MDDSLGHYMKAVARLRDENKRLRFALHQIGYGPTETLEECEEIARAALASLTQARSEEHTSELQSQ